MTYRDSGVDIHEAERALRAVTRDIESTHNSLVLGGVGGFGSLFSAKFPDLEHPVLVSSIDGVGTKTKVAGMVGQFRNLGADIVNHCVNDILCQGARPLFFLDYLGVSHLKAEIFAEILTGMTEACRAVDCALIGGETAEMPGVYVEEEFDVVGSIVGVVDYDKRLPKPTVRAGDCLIGLPSNGLHTNGFSLARRALFESGGLSVREPLANDPEGRTLGEALLAPHRCYAAELLPLLAEPESPIKALAHVTGGGFYQNLPRVLPSRIQALIERDAWEVPPIFRAIQEQGGIDDAEMFLTFNMGIGMIAVVDKDDVASTLSALAEQGLNAKAIGSLQSGTRDVKIV